MRPTLILFNVLVYVPGMDGGGFRQVPMPADPGYVHLQRAIGPLVGGPIEHVAVLADIWGGTNYRRSDMFVHERGGLIGLPVNAAATVIYLRAHLTRHPDADLDELPKIHGTAVLFERIVWS